MMPNYTQIILMISALTEYNQKIGTPDEQSAFHLIKSFGKAMTHKDVLGLGADTASPMVAKNPLSALGQISDTLTKQRVNTWEDDEVDVISLAKVVNAVADIDPNDSSVNSEANGKKIIDSLPPMIRSSVEGLMEIADTFGSQLDPPVSIDKQPIGSPVMGELPLDPDTRILNKKTIVDTSQRKLI